MKFIDNIIYCSITDVSNFKKLSQKTLSASLDKINERFTLKLYKDSNIIASQIQIHFFLYNITRFKNGAAIIEKC